MDSSLPLIERAVLLAVSRPLSSWNRPPLTEVYLCHACSCQEILRVNTARQGPQGMLYRYIRANFYFEAAQTLALRQQVCVCERERAREKREERRQTQSLRVCIERKPGRLRGAGGEEACPGCRGLARQCHRTVVWGFAVFVSRGLVFTRCHRAQQLEQNRKDGLPEGSRGAQDPPGGLEEAQDFTQRAYTDYHATLQVPSPPSPTPTQRSRLIGGVRMPDVRCHVALLLTAGANRVRVRVRSFSRASARPPTGWPRWRAGREPGSGCVSPPRPTAVLAVEKPRRCVEKPRLPPPRSVPPSLLPSFPPSFLTRARAWSQAVGSTPGPGPRRCSWGWPSRPSRSRC
jgi:hypothetical protein